MQIRKVMAATVLGLGTVSALAVAAPAGASTQASAAPKDPGRCAFYDSGYCMVYWNWYSSWNACLAAAQPTAQAEGWPFADCVTAYGGANMYGAE
jgi:hypothetical protein